MSDKPFERHETQRPPGETLALVAGSLEGMILAQGEEEHE